MMSTSKSSHAPLALDVAEVDAAVGKGWNLPAQLYVDPAVLALEERAIFRRAWQIVGTERDVQKSGRLHHNHRFRCSRRGQPSSGQQDQRDGQRMQAPRQDRRH